MAVPRLIRPLASALIATLVAGCAPAPYVFHAHEFDRTQPGFGQEPTDIAEVAICYNRRGTTPETLRAMAEAECGRFGKTARFSHQRTLECPIMTPASAHFDCVAP